jgi:hypothetical protein
MNHIIETFSPGSSTALLGLRRTLEGYVRNIGLGLSARGQRGKVVSMYARVIQFVVDVDKIDAGIEGVEKALQETIKDLKGFAGCFLLVDRAANKGIYMTLYATREDADAVLQSGVSQDVISKLLEFLVGAPSIEGYEVAIKA